MMTDFCFYRLYQDYPNVQVIEAISEEFAVKKWLDLFWQPDWGRHVEYNVWIFLGQRNQDVKWVDASEYHQRFYKRKVKAKAKLDWSNGF